MHVTPTTSNLTAIPEDPNSNQVIRGLSSGFCSDDVTDRLIAKTLTEAICADNDYYENEHDCYCY